MTEMDCLWAKYCLIESGGEAEVVREPTEPVWAAGRFGGICAGAPVAAVEAAPVDMVRDSHDLRFALGRPSFLGHVMALLGIAKNTLLPIGLL